MAIALLAQFIGGVPLATAMALIGWGACLTLHTELLALANLAVYAVLVGYTIGSQSHAAHQSVSGQVNLVTSTDHAVALMLLAALTWTMLRRTLTTSR